VADESDEEFDQYITNEDTSQLRSSNDLSENKKNMYV